MPKIICRKGKSLHINLNLKSENNALKNKKLTVNKAYTEYNFICY